MELYEGLLTRRSVRNFKPDAVPGELLEKIAEAGLYAASGMGRQGTRILQITDPALRDRLMRMNAAIMGREGTDPFYGAPAVFVVLADKAIPTAIYDGSLVMGNLMLAAHAFGLGSCWIHRAKEEFESEEGKAILASLGVEGDYEGIGHCVVGYSAEADKEPAARRPGRIVRA